MQEGQQLDPEHVNAQTVADHFDMQQSLSSLAMTVGIETVAFVRGKKVLKEAPQRSSGQSRGNLFAAFDSCVPFFSVSVGVLTSVNSCTAGCAHVCTTLLLHQATVLTPTQEYQHGFSNLTFC